MTQSNVVEMKQPKETKPVMMHKRRNEIFLHLAKLCDNLSLRQYGTVIGIRRNRAYVTDGYYCLRWIPSGYIGDDCTLTAQLTESSIKYPDVESVWKPVEVTGSMQSHFFVPGASAQIEAMRKFLKPSWRGEICLVARINTQTGITLHPTSKEMKKQEKGKYDVIVNPLLIMKAVKGLPKGALCSRVDVYPESELVKISFEDGAEIFEILLVGIQ